jgi:hypothetical protein
VLVEKRITRVQKDGRRVLEKAQDKKKKTNLETTQGTSPNSFSLLSDLDILHISKDIGICLGADRKDEKQSILEILEKNRSRKMSLTTVPC